MGFDSRLGGGVVLALLAGAALAGGCGPKKASTPQLAGNAGAHDGDAGSDDGGSGNKGGNASGGSSNASGGRNNNGGSHSAQPATDLESFYEAEGTGYCQRVFRCFEGDDDFMSARFVLQTQARCERLVERINVTSAMQRDLRAEIDAGRLHLVAEQAQRCLADLAACNGPNGFSDDSCREAVEGSAALGEACQRSEDCAGEAYCQVDASCPGTCAARKAEGEPCSSKDECAYTGGVVTCYRGAAASTCHTLTRGAAVGLGKPCTRRLDDASELITCQDGSWCDTAPGGDPSQDILGVCAPPIAEGQPCRDSDDVCLTGFCDTETLVCTRVKVVTAVGEACNKEEYVVCDPLLGLVCGDDLKCHGSGDGAEGSGCYSSDYQMGCEPGLYCDRTGASSSDDLGACRQLRADGEPCVNGNGCVSGGCTAESVCGGRVCIY